MDKQYEAIAIAVLVLATGFLLTQKLVLLATLLMLFALVIGIAVGLIKA